MPQAIQQMPRGKAYFQKAEVSSPTHLSCHLVSQYRSFTSYTSGIHRAYWLLYDASRTGQGLSDEEFPPMASPSHIRHCIDLIRQALMCHSDRTIEPKDDTGGVSGFGVMHSCVDYWGLIERIEEWQT
ncbi:hypothetical protein F4808DRAFT_437233 [Astrocystis sublimbata]|nr:hypothetical protein F4808DRAFT_437233 [Astrocystis sublimbata]